MRKLAWAYKAIAYRLSVSVITSLLCLFLVCSSYSAEKGTWDTILEGAGDTWDGAQKESQKSRINDLPGNPGDVDKRNVFTATAREIYDERRSIVGKLEKLKRIKEQEDARYFPDKERISTINSNIRRLNDRLEILNNERYRRIAQGKWYGFVPEDEDKPQDPAPAPDPNWGGDLPEVSDKNPTTMGRSEIEPEMRQLNEDREKLRKRLDQMNAVGDFAGKIGQKAQVEEVLKKVIERLKILEAEKQNQIKNGTWGYSSDDITRTDATAEQLKQAYEDGKELGRQVKNGQMSSAEVRQATQAAYGKYDNNEKCKEAFKKGYSEAVQ